MQIIVKHSKNFAIIQLKDSRKAKVIITKGKLHVKNQIYRNEFGVKIKTKALNNIFRQIKYVRQEYYGSLWQ